MSESIEDLNAVLARAVARAGDKKGATERLRSAVVIVGTGIGAAAKAAKLRAWTQLGHDLDGDDGYEPIGYDLIADSDGEILIGRDDGAEGWNYWWTVVGTSVSRCGRSVPRHVLVLVAGQLAPLAEELAAKCERMAIETEAAAELAGRLAVAVAPK